jgi:hypothetical protein
VVDFFNEVEEELRADRVRNLVQKYARPVITIAIVVLVVLAASVSWHYWRKHQAAQASEAYDRGVEAMAQGDRTKADAAFAEAAKGGSGGYKSLALMARAGLVPADKPAEAVKLLDQAAKAAPDPIIGDAARLKAALLLLDKEPYAKLEERLKPLMKEKAPYRPLAMELLAFAKLNAGRTKEARNDLVVLSSDLDAPPSIQQRAQLAIQLIDSGQAGQVVAIAKAAAALPPEASLPANLPINESAGVPAPQAGAGPQ